MNHYGTSKTQFPMGIADITSPDQLQVPDKSALERIIKSSNDNNGVQINLHSRLRSLLVQLRGDRPVAGGCGGEVKTNSCALAVLEGSVADHSAMHCGKDAREAVQVAIDLDCYSGGRVDSFTAGQPAFIVVEK